HTHLGGVCIFHLPAPPDVVEQDILAKTADEVSSRVANGEVRVWKLDLVELHDFENLFLLAVIPVEGDVPLGNQPNKDDNGRREHDKKSGKLENFTAAKKPKDKVASEEGCCHCSQHDDLLRQQSRTLYKKQVGAVFIRDVILFLDGERLLPEEKL